MAGKVYELPKPVLARTCKTQNFCSTMNSHSSQSKSLLYPLFRKASESDNDDDKVPLSSLADHGVVERRTAKRRRTSQASSRRRNDGVVSAEDSTTASTTTLLSLGEQDGQTEGKNDSVVCGKQQPESTKETDTEKETDTAQDSRPPYTRHVLHQLVHRSVTGRVIHTPPPLSWSPLALLDTNGAVVTCTAWDNHVGVLLAVATTTARVYLYDWDVVRAHRPRDSTHTVESMHVFSVPHVVTSMQWDTHDSLCMTFRGLSLVRVYNVARLVETTQQRENDSFTNLFHNTIRSEAVAVQYLPRRQWLVSHRDGNVVLYKCKSNNNKTFSLQWKWNADQDCVTRIVPLPDTHTVLLVGQARWIQLDYKTCTRLAFSTTKTPTVVQRWNFGSTTQRYGSVQSIQVTSPQQLHCKWMTSRGWILSMNLLTTSQSSPRVLHGPPRVLIQTSSSFFTEVKTSTLHYSQPLQSVVADSTRQFTCWETVPTVTHVLPHHDRRNVGGSLQVVRSCKRSLSIMDSYHRIRNLSMAASAISAVTLHPSNEWLLVGNERGQLQVWTARKLPKKKRQPATSNTTTT